MSIRGIADSYLDCANPSTHTFKTWALAQSYYKICFEAGCVHIRKSQAVQTPIHSPVRKKTKVHSAISRLPGGRAPPQPVFSPVMSRNTPLNSPSVSSQVFSPLSFPESPAPAISSNHQKHHGPQGDGYDSVAELARSINRSPHHGRKATALGLIYSSAKATALGAIHSSAKATALESIHFVTDQSQLQVLADLTPLPPVVPRRIIVVDSDSSDERGTASAVNSENGDHLTEEVPTLSVSSSLVVESSSGPASHHADSDSPVIVVSSDSEEEMHI